MAQEGRPPKFTSPEELEKLVDDYFENYDRWTLAGLAVHLGMCRATLYNYENKDEFLDIIKKARAFVEKIYEERLVWDNATGVIFPLKNMGWKDKTEVENSGKLGFTVVMQPAPNCEPLKDDE